MRGLVKQFTICLGVFAVLLLKMMELLCVIGGALLDLWYVVLGCHQYDVCENSVGNVYIGGYGGLSESGLCVFRELWPVSFLVVVVVCSHAVC